MCSKRFAARLNHDTMTHEITVSNISCSSCENSIKNALGKMEGIEKIEIENKEILRVTGNVERSIIVKTISELGYPEKGKDGILKKAGSFLKFGKS